MTDDIRLNGSSRSRFKDANLSLFFKKGDPTLVSNYRPISSMNTDCKMYTNLVNNRLSPWAVSLIHQDQKGFVPGRYITEHTRLASEVAHLSDLTGTDGYIVSLDQAKAYDRVDLSWLLAVLRRMRVDEDLVSLISDVVFGCRTRVRINGAYSKKYGLKRGVRQGDPLSCLLYAFAIEPMGMELRNAIIGISVLGLPHVRLIQFADDMNLFLSAQDDLRHIRTVLRNSSLALGSKFNYEKTDILRVGSAAHRERDPNSDRYSSLLSCFTGAFILPAGSPLRVLGVWVGSPDFAAARWAQVSTHISKIIRQWQAIGASFRNRVLLAKALLLSRCYYLLDGNGIPHAFLVSISQKIMRFVRGRFNNAPYHLLSAPLEEGGLDCPSLLQRRLAYDAKFFSDLISAPSGVPWKAWTMADLSHASSHLRSRVRDSGVPLNPLMQHAHVCQKLLEPRVRQGFKSLRSLRYELSRCFPSRNARHDMPVAYHPAVDSRLSKRPARLHDAGIVKVRHLDQPGKKLSNIRDRAARSSLKRKSDKLRAALSDTQWSDSARFWSSKQILGPRLRVWPAMKGALGCASILGRGPSLLMARSGISTFLAPATSFPLRLLKVIKAMPLKPTHTRMGIFSMPVCPPRPKQAPVSRVPGAVRSVTVWTDGSAVRNGEDRCVAGASWFCDDGTSAYARIVGVIPTNNIAGLSAVAMALLSWQTHSLHIMTDSKFVLGLVGGGLLAMERDGWPDTPYSNHYSPVSLRPLLKYVLYLMRRHNAGLDFSWVKGHSGVEENEAADALAKRGVDSDTFLFDVSSLFTPRSWVDDAPVLNHLSLSHITYCVVRDMTPPPLLSSKFDSFREEWSTWMSLVFNQEVDLLRVYRSLWTINIPKGLRELLWKESSGSLPLGHRWHGTSPLGNECRCGQEVTLPHIWEGCGAYNLWPLKEEVISRLGSLCPSDRKTLNFVSWPSPYWLPLLCLKQLEKSYDAPRKEQRALRDSRAAREWAIGAYLWAIWRWRVKEMMEDNFVFLPVLFVETLRKELGVG